jgi:hypothetical protein
MNRPRPCKGNRCTVMYVCMGLNISICMYVICLYVCMHASMYVSMATMPLIRIEVKRLRTQPNPIQSQYYLPLCEPDRAKDEIHAFLSDPENEGAMDLRFEKLAANVAIAASDVQPPPGRRLSRPCPANTVLLLEQAKRKEVSISYARLL